MISMRYCHSFGLITACSQCSQNTGCYPEHTALLFKMKDYKSKQRSTVKYQDIQSRLLWRGCSWNLTLARPPLLEIHQAGGWLFCLFFCFHFQRSNLHSFFFVSQNEPNLFAKELQCCLSSNASRTADLKPNQTGIIMILLCT